MPNAIPVLPQQRPDRRLLAAANTIAGLQAAVPAAYRERGLPDLAELAEHASAISPQHQLLLTTAAALARSPHAGAHRAAVRPLSDAAEKLGRAIGTISRASAMAGRLYDVDGLDGPAAHRTRQSASQHLNLALSHTRLALSEAVENLRTDARSLTPPTPTAPGAARIPHSSAALAAGNRAVVAVGAPPARAELPASHAPAITHGGDLPGQSPRVA